MTSMISDLFAYQPPQLTKHNSVSVSPNNNETESDESETESSSEKS